MPDIFSAEKRSLIMSHVKSGNTKPEVKVRKLLHKMGYRFRLRPGNLPGKPDIVLPKYNKIILVNGCFWHGHKGCCRSQLPSSNTQFWKEKIDKNVKRDKKTIANLRELGWSVTVVWQCQLKDVEKLSNRLKKFILNTK